jgi:hypothetical protein
MKKSSCVFLLSFLATSFSPTFSSPEDCLFNEPLVYTVPSLAASVMCGDIGQKVYEKHKSFFYFMCYSSRAIAVASPLTQYIWRLGTQIEERKGLLVHFFGCTFSAYCLFLVSTKLQNYHKKCIQKYNIYKEKISILRNIFVYGTGGSYVAWKIYNLARYVLNK